MTSDLSGNLMSGLYSLIAHNSEVIVYVSGSLLSVIALFIKPTRLALLYLLGFGLLAFNFEYDKHLMLPLRAQTIATVAGSPDTHLYTQRLVNLFLTDLVPVMLFLLGWGILFVAITLSLTKNPKTQIQNPK